ncbi:unnamed protein product [Paramecium pentaurelia]|uniref:Uncharacterized protein n=1 Tax=Paramecium pentaurelia TaxID=43138 RepID=A0A8S1XCT3_9CILI|nr:unnamed protein product [Paramecium pentaurelia]
MSTIEKKIQKLRQQHQFTHNSIEIHSNASFFDEERSQDFQDDVLSSQEDFQYYQQKSSLYTNKSIMPPQSLENYENFQRRTSPTQVLMSDQFVQESVNYFNQEIDNNTVQTGKGIAIHVLGQGSIGKQTKKGKKIEKNNQKKIQNLNNQININNNEQEQQSQQFSLPNNNFQSQSNSQQTKQICQTQKVILAYLMVESDVSKQAQQRAQNFIQKYMQNVNDKEILINIQETYKILLLPDQIVQQLAQVLSQKESIQYLNLSLHRLNLPNNKHPLAAKAADKIRKLFQSSC